MNLSYLAPPPDLSEYISAYYLFESDDGEIDDLERASIAQVRITLSGVGEVRVQNGQPMPIPSVALLGPRTTWSRVSGHGPVIRMFGAGLLPAGWAVATRLGADSFANLVVPLQSIFDQNADDFAQRIGACTDFAAMAEVMTEAARLRSARAIPGQLEFVRILNHWLESDLSPDVSDLTKATGLSARQVERRAKQFFGAPPKYLVRMYRALRAANAIANGEGAWQDFANSAFYDQSHFIREIRHFTGLTPSAVRDHHSRLTQLAFGRHQLAGDVGPLVANS